MFDVSSGRRPFGRSQITIALTAEGRRRTIRVMMRNTGLAEGKISLPSLKAPFPCTRTASGRRRTRGRLWAAWGLGAPTRWRSRAALSGSDARSISPPPDLMNLGVRNTTPTRILRTSPKPSPSSLHHPSSGGTLKGTCGSRAGRSTLHARLHDVAQRL